MRTLCNELVFKARHHLDSSTLFAIEPLQAVEKLLAALKACGRHPVYLAGRARATYADALIAQLHATQVCGTFKSTYFDYKSKTALECPQNPWKVQNSLLFAHLDAFLERSHDVLSMFRIFAQFGTRRVTPPMRLLATPAALPAC